MGYKDWKQENEQAGGNSFDSWKQQNVSMGVATPQGKYSEEMVDYAFKKYQDTIRPEEGHTVKGFNRKAFERYGQATKWIEGGATRTPRSHMENLSESYSRGKENFDMDQEYYEASLIGDTAKEDKIFKQWKMNQARDALDPIGTDGNLVTKASYGAANIMPGMIEGAKQAAPIALAGGGLALIGGQLGPQVIAPEEIITVPLGIVAGFKLGATYAWYKQGTGSMRLSMRDKGIKSDVANAVSSIAGVPYALIEQLQVDHLIPGIRQAANKVISKSMARIAAVVSKKYAVTLGSETLEEVVQEGIGMIAEDIAGLLSGLGMDVSIEELKERGFRLWNTAKQSAIAMAFLPIPGAAVDISAGIKGKKLVGKFEDAGYNPRQAQSMASKVDEGVTPVIAHRMVVDETIVDSHNTKAGSIVSRQSGRSISKGFPVDTGAESSIAGKIISAEQVQAFRVRHNELLADPAMQVSTWYDEEYNMSHIDLVHVAKTEGEAKELGTEYGQPSVLNIETGETIPLPVEKASTVVALTERKRLMMIQLDEDTDSTAKEYGLTTFDAQQRMDNAERRHIKLTQLKSKKDLTFSQDNELKFLDKNKKNLYALLERDTGPIENKIYSKKEIMNRVHNLSDLLGYDIVKRRNLQTKLTGKDSLTKMVPAQREQVMMFLEREAKEQGANIEGIDTTPVGELMTKLRERKQKPKLNGRDRRIMTSIRKALYDTERGVSYYFLNNSRVRRICRALDNYEDDGPFSKYIFRAVRYADARATANFTAVMEGTLDAFKQQDIDAAAMMIEVKDIPMGDIATIDAERLGDVLADNPIGDVEVLEHFTIGSEAKGTAKKDSDLDIAVVIEPKIDPDSGDDISSSKFSEQFHQQYASEGEVPTTEDGSRKIDLQFFYANDPELVKLRSTDRGSFMKDKLSTSDRMGVYALAKNEKTYNHLLATFSEEEIDIIIKSVEGDEKEMTVVNELTAYFEHSWPEFEAIAKATGVKGLVKEENYITAFINDDEGTDTPDFLEGLVQQFSDAKTVPGKERTIARKPKARRNLAIDIFAIHARAVKSIERFKMFAPVASKVGSILGHRGFKNNLNNATYGHGSKLMDKWLQDSVRGKSAYDNSRFAPMLKWLRVNSMSYVIGFKILTAAKQGVSSLQGMMASPKMIPLVIANLAKGSRLSTFKKMQAEVKSKSELMRTRDWNRDLRAAWNKKHIRKFYQGKKLSPLAMRMAMNIDQHTTTAVWYSAYQLSQGEGMNERESVQFADGVVQDTQPMANASDLPTYFRGSEFEKTLTIFQNQVNQNGQMLWYDIIGERRAGKINNTQVAYRLMMSQILPAMLLGMISRGRPPESAEEIAKDLAAHFLSPFVFLGRLAYNVAAGDWGPSNNIALTPALETQRMVSAMKRGDVRGTTKYTARTIGAWSGGKIPLQAVTSAEGAWDLATGETEDFRRLVWSEYAMKTRKKKESPGVKY